MFCANKYRLRPSKYWRDFYQFSLALAKNGMYSHPLNQTNQEYSKMTEIRNELDKILEIKGQEKFQTIVRIGREENHFKVTEDI